MLILAYGCANPKANSQDHNRIMHHYIMDSLVMSRDYKLKIEVTNGLKLYRYQNSIDSTKNIVLQYDHKQKTIKSGPFTFELSHQNVFQNENISAKGFNLYIEKPHADSNNPILFNEDYGVLKFGYSVNHFIMIPSQISENTIIEIIDVESP